MVTPNQSSLMPLWILIFLQVGVSASSMVVEVVAGRMIAPYVGMSLYTWTAIIAVVLAGFSAGHWWGGRIAARETGHALRLTGWTMVAAACTTAGATLLLRSVSGPVLENVTQPLAAIMALSSVAFFLPSLFAGVPAPVLTVAAMRGRRQSEQALGAMYAAGALGAIAGTLMAGFVFVPWLGSVKTLLAIGAIYAFTASLCFWLGRASRGEYLFSFVGLGIAAAIGGGALGLPSVCDRESSYYCIRTVPLSADPQNPVNLMVVDHLAHGVSAGATPRTMFTDHAALLDALPRMRMARTDFSSFHIGGGSYSVPRAWADRGTTDITIAEIDPEVTAQATEDFWFDPATVNIVHRDARMALRDSGQVFDAIIGDAFTDIAVPEHLVTLEFFQLVSDRLAPKGVFAMNLIDNVDRLDALAAVFVTLQDVFPSVEVWTEARPPVAGERRIFVLLAGEEDSPVSAIAASAPDKKRFQVLDPGFLGEIIRRKQPRVLTDDKAPLGYLMGLDPLND